MRRIISLLLAILLVGQSATVVWAEKRPAKTFFEKSGWLDHLSNTMRRVAQQGEAGAYRLYKNPNPSPRNAYERANIHQANLTDLAMYKNSTVYRQAKQIRDAFLPNAEPASPATEESLTPEDLREIRSAVAELMALYRTKGLYYPIVVQSVLEVAHQLLPLQKQYWFFSIQDIKDLKALYRRILTAETQCGQGEGYRLFCEGRADALESLAWLAQGDQDAQLMVQALKQDLQQPIISRELLAAASALLDMEKERFLEPVLEEAVKREGDNFWQKIDVFMTGWWIDKIQFSQGRYLGNVSALGVLPEVYEGADGNVWEELARMLYNQGSPSADSARLLARYGLGSCEAKLHDFDGGKMIQSDGHAVYTSVQCRTLLPFLAGALASGVKEGAPEELNEAAQSLHLSAAALVARLYFENVMGDLNAETELRLDQQLYGVFEQDIRAAEKKRQETLAHNQRLNKQIQQLQKQLDSSFLPYDAQSEDSQLPFSLDVRLQIAALEKQKVPVPARPDCALKPYDRQSDVYRRKQTGQNVYRAVRRVSGAVDVGLGIYYTLALPAMAWKGAQWGISLRNGIQAVRAGHITAEARQLAALSGRLKKIRSLRLSSAAKAVKQGLEKAIVSIKQSPIIMTDLPQMNVAKLSFAMNGPQEIKMAAAATEPGKAGAAVRQTKALTAAGNSVRGVGETVSAAGKTAAAPQISTAFLRRMRLQFETTPATAQHIDWEHMYLAAWATLQKMQQLTDTYKGSLTNVLSVLKQNPANMGKTLRLARDYARMEKDIAFYQKLRAEAGLPADKITAFVAEQKGVLAAKGRMQLAGQYISLLQKRFAQLPAGSSTEKARLVKEIKAAWDIHDELAAPEVLAWPKDGVAGVPAMRRRLTELIESGTLSALQKQEARQLLNKLLVTVLDNDQQAISHLRILNIPFLQKAPNTIWIWGDDFSGKDLLIRKTPLGFPIDQIVHNKVFPDIAPLLQQGKENVLLINGHGYISTGENWKLILRKARVGERRPQATLTAEKVIEAALNSDVARTSVYIHSCQSGAVFNDLKDLFQKFPQAAKRTEWFTNMAPMQAVSVYEIPAVGVGSGVRERLLNKLLLQIMNNGNGLAARAWVGGREVYPLRASVQRLAREIEAAPQAQKAALLDLQRDLQQLLDIADASDIYELQKAIGVFSSYHPGNVLRGLYGGEKEFRWGIKQLPDERGNINFFIFLKPQWVDYVAQTAQEMFALFKEPSSSWSTLSHTEAVLSSVKRLNKEFVRAPQIWERLTELQKSNPDAWRNTLLGNTAIRDFSESIEWGRSVLRDLESKWTGRGITQLSDLEGQPSLMRQALQDVSSFAQLEKQLDAAEKLFSLYNQQAGFATWQAPSAAPKLSALFAVQNRAALAEKYISYLSKKRRHALPFMRSAVERELAQAIKWKDAFALDGVLPWSSEYLPSAPALRNYLELLGENKKNFSLLQRMEYNSLKRALHRNVFFGGERLLELQNRIFFLPQAHKTPNSVFLWGDDLLPRQAWERKTLVGFFRPKMVRFVPMSEVLKSFKAGEENVLLAHVHGGISRNGTWKGILVEGIERPTLTFSAEEILQALPQTRSLYSSIYLNGCFSGTLMENVLALKSRFPQEIAKSDWFVTAGRFQYTSAESLPAEITSGTTRKKLFSKLISRMRYNGDGLAARALIEGKEIYPLHQSVLRLGRQIRKSAPEEKEALVRLQQELTLLEKVADARTNKELLHALLSLEEARPGTVHNIKLWQNSTALMGLQSRPAHRIGPDGFGWGVDLSKATVDHVPFVQLKQQWVDYVSDTAQKLFERVSQLPAAVKPVFEPEAFKPLFSSKTSEYIFTHRRLSLMTEGIDESFFKIPVHIPSSKEIKLNRFAADKFERESILARYIDLTEEFERIRKEINVAFYYAKKNPSALTAMEKRALENDLSSLRSRLLIFQHEELKGKPVQSMVDWIENAGEILFPIQRGHVLDMPSFPRPDRIYKHKEFFLRDPNGKAFDTPQTFSSPKAQKHWLLKQESQLPKRVAVLNDDEVVLGNYDEWISSGKLGNHTQWTFYWTIDDFMKDLKNGEKFDLIISDLNFSDGAAHYWVAVLRTQGEIHTPIIASSSFPEQAIDGMRLMHEGFDGYLSVTHLSCEYGAGNLLRALNNYFKYRDANKWIR